ncbi:MAG TPA: AAA family ATPase [Myxococcales bacterium]|nr:AAA family ATPase [Myxococcales bacterium]
MQPIRSLLWIGPAQGLAESRVAESPTLDITWVPSVEAALALPPMTLDAALVAGPNPDVLIDQVRQWQRRPGAGPVLAWLEVKDPAEDQETESVARAIRQLLETGAQEVLLAPGPGAAGDLRRELLARLDALAERALSGHPTPRQSVSGQGMSGQGMSGQDVSGQGMSGQGMPGQSIPEQSMSGVPGAEPGHPDSPESPSVVGQSAAMRDIHALIWRAAHSRATVLVQGETGTGKELVARLVHARGPRRKATYVAINCAAFPESLLESELFGHRKGAFTGADRDRPGHFELAHRGTLFLDEIGETSPALQAKLLRVLQEREVLPVGGNRPRPVDVRVIAATNRDLGEETRAGRFREDLFYRLAVFPITLPSLRERPEDILELANHFLHKHGQREQKPGCQLSAAARRLLLSHAWPGNVRELENEIQRALALAETGECIGPRLLSPRLTGLMEAIAQAPHAGESLHASLCSIEAWLIRRALDHNGGRRALTARKLGVTREGLYKKMKRLGIA